MRWGTAGKSWSGSGWRSQLEVNRSWTREAVFFTNTLEIHSIPLAAPNRRGRRWIVWKIVWKQNLNMKQSPTYIMGEGGMSQDGETEALHMTMTMSGASTGRCWSGSWNLKIEFSAFLLSWIPFKGCWCMWKQESWAWITEAVDKDGNDSWWWPSRETGKRIEEWMFQIRRECTGWFFLTGSAQKF